VADVYDVAIVGGGPAGAATAIRLARGGYRVVLFERHATAAWRACGVFASPLVRARLRDLGLGADEITALHRPINVMELESDGAHCRLQYEHGLACGFDRVRLDARLLEMAAHAGAEIRRATVVRDVQLSTGRGSNQILVASALATDSPPHEAVAARMVVGADGGGSRVARAAGVLRETNWLGRAGITFHLADPGPPASINGPMSARFFFDRGWYVGIAPVPNDRVNIGIVVPARRLREGVATITDGVVRQVGRPSDRWRSGARTDEPQVAGRLEHHVARVAGDGWLLVGDATGFIDPLTGEGIHRALVTAQLAARAIDGWLAGDHRALAVYDRRVRLRFRSKNVLSVMLQGFLANPGVRDYALRRLDRDPELRAVFTGALSDQLPASSALHPRFMARLLAP
jgi:menaquinone-9 beta-reductase